MTANRRRRDRWPAAFRATPRRVQLRVLRGGGRNVVAASHRPLRDQRTNRVKRLL
jgi:hypothetical protein